MFCFAAYTAPYSRIEGVLLVSGGDSFSARRKLSTECPSRILFIYALRCENALHRITSVISYESGVIRKATSSYIVSASPLGAGLGPTHLAWVSGVDWPVPRPFRRHCSHKGLYTSSRPRYHVSCYSYDVLSLMNLGELSMKV